MAIQVFSEIGKLQTVLLHRPGKELENLTPSILNRLLFDDIPYLKIALEEHNAFAEILRNEGVEVLYLTDLVVETLKAQPEIIGRFIDRFISDAKIQSKTVQMKLKEYLEQQELETMINSMIAGIRKNAFIINKVSMMDFLQDEYPFYTDPMPNILFQRDPFASIGTGISLHQMSTHARQRETIFPEYIFKYHPRFQDEPVPMFYQPHDPYALEGGDILVLNAETLAIGISKRTDPRAIERMAKRLFNANQGFKTILALNIPKSRAFMHLDTVFTQVDHDKFTVHRGILETLTIFEITYSQEGLNIKKVRATLQELLEQYLKRPITLIHCGGDDIVNSEREQWNDGANTLAIAPGKVVVYSRNHETNALLKQAGLTVLEMPSSELSRGRGGPRCMSMPLKREIIKENNE